VSLVSSSPTHTALTITSRPMWRLRLARDLPRYLLQGLALAGILASARFAIAPPRSPVARVSMPDIDLLDRAAEGFASLFARRYLTWDSRDPEIHRRALASFVNPSMEAEAGLQPPESGAQQVQWTQVVQSRELLPDEHVYTVAVQTDTSGLLYLTVGVLREKDGRLALAGYPAFVGAPATSSAVLPEQLREVEDSGLETVVRRALRNYLEGFESELAADLSAGAEVSLPGLALALESTDGLYWSAVGRSVLAVVRARDGHGTQYTLGYELDVLRDGGRWEVSAIQTSPDG
jgi:hypothetical protein